MLLCREEDMGKQPRDAWGLCRMVGSNQKEGRRGGYSCRQTDGEDMCYFYELLMS
jgi:hypothetical protein